MIVETARFGSIDVEASSVVSMPRGMFGFEGDTEFCLIQHRPDGEFMWLQSTRDPELAFIVVDPFRFFDEYLFRLTSVEADYLGLTVSDDAIVLTTVSVEPETFEVTANLAGPIVINCKSLSGMQVALDDERYGTKHVLDRSGDTAGDELPKAA